MNKKRKQQVLKKGQINWKIVAADIIEHLDKINNSPSKDYKRERLELETKDKKECTKCKQVYPALHIYFETYISRDKRYMRKVCRKCRNIGRKEYSRDYYEKK